MERVLFSLMHIAAEELSPNTVIWLFYALESLFTTRVGENRKGLEERINLLLQPSDKEWEKIRKKLIELYDYRSSMVHGGLEIIHVMHNENTDKAVEDAYLRLNQLADFGFRLLLASIQETIKNGWQVLKFKQVLER